MTPKLSIAEAAGHFALGGRYLNTAAIGIPPRACVEAMQQSLLQWSRGELAPTDFDPFVASARASFARLMGVSAEDVAIGAAVSDFVGVVASSLPRGSEVLCAEGDFASVLYPFLVRQEAGELLVRVVPLERMVEAITPATALVALSAVQSADGRVFDAAGLRAACRQHGAATLIDATQAAGWLPLSASDFDFVAAAAYKWLLAPRGAAFFYVNPRQLQRLRPHAAGWYANADVWGAMYDPSLRLAPTARRLDSGPAWLAWVGCAASLAFLERVGVQAIFEHDVRLAAIFRERALGGRRSVGSADSAFLSVPGSDAFERLRARGISVSRRAGAARLSFHLYNTEDDAIAAAEAVRNA